MVTAGDPLARKPVHDFEYQRPSCLAEALELLARDGARPLAGGTDLIPQLREGRNRLQHVVDLKHAPEFAALERGGDGAWRIGAAVAVGRLARETAFAREHAALLDAARLIGSLQIQNRASLGGNLCNAAPSADAVPLLMALDAVAVVAGPAGERRVPAGDIPVAPGRTSLAPGEVLVALELPPPARRSAARYLRFTPRREMDIAVAGAGVRLDLAEDGRIGAARVVLASVAPTPLPVPAVDAMLVGEVPTAELMAAAAALAAQHCRPISDTRGSAGYRRDLVAVLTRRALADCARRLGALT